MADASDDSSSESSFNPSSFPQSDPQLVELRVHRIRTAVANAPPSDQIELKNRFLAGLQYEYVSYFL
jgi:hypothetical protein